MGNKVDELKVVISGDAKALKKEVTASEKALRSLASGTKSAVASMSGSFVSLAAKAKAKFTEMRNDVNKAADAMRESMAKGTTSANAFSSALRSGLAIIGVRSLVSFTSEASTAATQLESSQLRVQDIFRESSATIEAYAKNNAQALGMSQKAAYEYAATYGNLFTTFTSSAETNATLTTAMLNASAVVASKTGRTMQDVMERIRSGLLGNTEAIEDLGINVNVAMIETTEAFEKMADGRSWEQLDYKEQQQIRTLAILEQAQKKYGDEVSQSSALTKAKASAAIEDFKASFGTLVNQILIPALPVVTKLFTGLAWVSSAIANASTPAKILLGISGALLAVMLLSISATKIYALAIKGVAAMKIIWGAVTSLLIPKVITLGTVLKAALGWIGLIVGVIGLFSAFLGDSADDTDSIEDVNDVINNTSESADAATAAVNGLKAGLEGVSNAAKGLAGFDKINQLSKNSSTSVNGGNTGNLLDNYIDDILNSKELVTDAIMPTTQTESVTKKAWNTLLEDVFSGNWSTFWRNWKSGAADIANNVKDKIKKALNSTTVGKAAYNMFSDIFHGNWGSFWSKWKAGASDIVYNIREKIGRIKQTHIAKAMSAMLSDIFSGNWSSFFSKWKSGATDIVNNINQKIWGADTKTVNASAKSMFSDIFHGNWSTFWSRWTSGAETITNNLSNKIFGCNKSELKSAWNSLLDDVFQGEWDKFWKNWSDGLAEIKSRLYELLGVETGSSTHTSSTGRARGGKIGKFATGGVITSPTIGLMGEAGKEVIMPLENNNGWIREIALEQARYMAAANRSNGSGSTAVYIGNSKLDGYIVRSQGRRNKRGGGR